MKVIIITEGGQDIGFGHLTRCLSLYQAFEVMGHEVQYIINGDSSTANHLEDKKYININWLRQDAELVSHLKDIDAAIVDSYLAGIDSYKKISNQVKIAVYLDDNRRLDYPPGIVLNWGIYAMQLDYPEKANMFYLLGPGYISLRQAFWHVERKKIQPEVKRVMMTFGGDDSKNMTPKVLGFLTRHYPRLEKNVVIGGAYKNIDEIKAVMDGHTHLIHSPGEEGMRDVMLASDIAFSSGGQTLYELACIGVPTVAVTVADNQHNNVKAWEETGFIENAGYWSDPNLTAALPAKFLRFMDFEQRLRSAEAGRKQVPQNGAQRIIHFIQSKINL
jgi:UDP-2,4-diacetamido-2,4,6-trideoxy-beta-L-altropyranose hydrolase